MFKVSSVKVGGGGEPYTSEAIEIPVEESQLHCRDLELKKL